jgi:hypothetical protein
MVPSGTSNETYGAPQGCMSNSRKTGLLSDGIVDSAMVETVFKTIKNELAWKTIFQTGTAAELALGRHRRLLQSTSATFRSGIQIAAIIRGRNGHHRVKASPLNPDKSSCGFVENRLSRVYANVPSKITRAVQTGYDYILLHLIDVKTADHPRCTL